MSVYTWTASINTALSDQSTATQQARSVLYQLVNLLIASGWTAVQSSDGSAVTSTNWAALSALNWAASGAHSWIVLKSPVGIVAGANNSYAGDQSCLWFSIDLNSANVYQASFRFHIAAPTGGTTSAVPTSTQQVGYAAQQFLRSAFAANALLHVNIASNGAFYWMVGYSSAGYTPFALLLAPVANIAKKATSGEDYPYGVAIYARWRDASGGALFNVGYYPNVGDPADTSPWNVSWLGWTFAGVAGSFRVGQYSYATVALASGSYWTTQGYMLGNFLGASAGAWTGKQIYGGVPVICTTSGAIDAIGELADIYCSGQTVAQGTLDSASAPTLMNIGSYLLPTNAAITL